MSRTAEQIQKSRAKHHAALEVLAATVGCQVHGLTLWRKLRRLENRVHAECTEYSNESSYGQARWDADKDAARAELARIFGGQIPAGVYVNGDPRGHALKLDHEKTTIPEGMQTDWGSDGILAAEIDE